MRPMWRELNRGCGVVVLPDLQLWVWWGGGEPTRALWRLTRSGVCVTWATVGEA